MVRQPSFLKLSASSDLHQLVCHGLATILFLLSFDFGIGSCKAKVANLEVVVLINQDVSWLDISVHHIRLMKKVQGAKKFKQDHDCMLLGKIDALLAEELFEITAYTVHDNEDVGHVLRDNKIMDLHRVDVFFHFS